MTKCRACKMRRVADDGCAAEALMARGLPFVFATGYGAAAVPENFRAAPVLQKPFRIADLERGVRTPLAAPRVA